SPRYRRAPQADAEHRRARRPVKPLPRAVVVRLHPSAPGESREQRRWSPCRVASARTSVPVVAARPRGLEFAVLGPLLVLDSGRVVRIGGGKLRLLLAAMLMRPREVRSWDDLIDDLWGEQAPETARSSLHNLVSALRRALGGVIETSCSGYALA